MASSFLVSETMVPFANPVASTGLRFILGSLMILPFVYAKARSYLRWGVLLRYGTISIFLVLFFIGMFTALKTTTALHTSVIYTFVPFLSVMGSFLWLNMGTSLVQMSGFAVGVAGAIWVLLIGSETHWSDISWYQGDGIFLLSCCSLVIHILLTKKWGSDIPPSIGAFFILFTGAIIMLPILWILGDLSAVAWLEWGFWKTLLYLTVFATLATFFLQQYLIQTVGPNMLLAYTYLIPTLVAVGAGVLVPELLLYSLPGMALTMFALYLISRGSSVPSKVT